MNQVGSPRVGERRKMYAEMGWVEWILANILKTARVYWRAPVLFFKILLKKVKEEQEKCVSKRVAPNGQMAWFVDGESEVLYQTARSTITTINFMRVLVWIPNRSCYNNSTFSKGHSATVNWNHGKRKRNIFSLPFLASCKRMRGNQ